MKKEEASQVGESLWYGGDEAATHRRGRRLHCPVMEAHTHTSLLHCPCKVLADA